MEIIYEKIMQQYGISYGDLPFGIRGRINTFKALHKKVFADPNNQDPERVRDLKIKDAQIHDEIQTWYERDFEEEQETPKPNNNMQTEQLKARAKAVGLPETATEAEIAAKEKANSDKAAADKAAADKAAADKAAADKAAADKAAAGSKAKAGDFFEDELDF